MILAEIFHFYTFIKMQKDYAESFTGSIKNFNLVTGFLVNDFTIDKLSYALIYFNIAECSSLITMQDIMHIATGKGFYRLVYKIRLHPYCACTLAFTKSMPKASLS